LQLFKIATFVTKYFPLQTFRKKERLCSKKQIQDIFESGKSFYVFPFKVIYKKAAAEEAEPIQVLISVPKRNIRKAVLRNKIKRRMREAYRQNKNQLTNVLGEEQKFSIIFIFTAKEEIPYKEIESKIIQILQRLPIQHAKDNQ
jgi:ribonuclease P protein component